MAPRTLQQEVKRVGLPTPHRLLLWGEAAWALRRLLYRESTCKEAAADGGFPSTSALSASLAPVLTTSPAAFARTGTFAAFVEGLRAECAGAHQLQTQRLQLL